MYVSYGHSEPICYSQIRWGAAMCTLLPHVTGHLILTKSGLGQFSKQLHCYLAMKGKLKRITLPKDDSSSGHVTLVRGTHPARLIC